MHDLLQLSYLAQQLGNVKANNMSTCMCCLCRLDLTANVESGSHDSVGQHDGSARQHGLSGICYKVLHSKHGVKQPPLLTSSMLIMH